MARLYKKNSIAKTVKISEVSSVTGQTIEDHGIVFVGDRVGVAFDKVDDKNVTVYFGADLDFATSDFVEGSLPAIGGKLYLNAEGKLEKTTSEKFVGYYWGMLETGGIVFSLAN